MLLWVLGAHRGRHLALVLNDERGLLQICELEGQPHCIETQLLEAPHNLRGSRESHVTYIRVMGLLG